MAHILAIDDWKEQLNLIRIVLEAKGHHVTTAQLGAEGVALARGLLPDLIICDTRMPGGMDGFAVLRALRDDPATASIPVVAFTAFAEIGPTNTALTAGFDAFLAKPARGRDLVAMVDRFTGQPPAPPRTP